MLLGRLQTECQFGATGLQNFAIAFSLPEPVLFFRTRQWQEKLALGQELTGAVRKDLNLQPRQQVLSQRTKQNAAGGDVPDGQSGKHGAGPPFKT